MPLSPLANEVLDFWFAPEPTLSKSSTDASVPASTSIEADANPLSSDEAVQASEAVVGARNAERRVWFVKDAAFDRVIRERFGEAIGAAVAGAFGEWCDEPRGALARVLLLDQFTRNAWRDSPQAFAGDARALATAVDAVARGYDRLLDPYERWFLYMPFEHSEALADQEQVIALFRALAAETGLSSQVTWAERHAAVIRRFGRFPHRNAILGRVSTPEEQAFLTQRGSRF
jgi:uncharacterized protein (DUF924 family)